MQAVLCLILFASAALAEWVVHVREIANVSRLETLQWFGPVGVRIPSEWDIQSQTRDLSLAVPQLVKVTVQESAPGRRVVRDLTVDVRKVRPTMSAEDMLGFTGYEYNLPSVPIKIGGVAGILVSSRMQVDTEMAPQSGPVQDDLIAGCVSPSGIAVIIVLKCPDETPEEVGANVEMIRDVAQAMMLHGRPTGP